MTLLLNETFGGSGAWPGGWTTVASGTATFSQTGGYGQVAAPSDQGGYNDRYEARNSATLTGGEARFDLVIPDKAEYNLWFTAAGSGAAGETWATFPQYGMTAQYTPVTSTVTYSKVANYAATSLGTATLTCAAGDTLHVVIKPGTGVFLWLNAAARPATPTVASADATYISGFPSVSYQGGNTAQARTLKYDNIVLDDLGAVAAPDKLRLGSSSVSLKVGASAASKAYIGATQVWP